MQNTRHPVKYATNPSCVLVDICVAFVCLAVDPVVRDNFREVHGLPISIHDPERERLPCEVATFHQPVCSPLPAHLHPTCVCTLDRYSGEYWSRTADIPYMNEVEVFAPTQGQADVASFHARNPTLKKASVTYEVWLSMFFFWHLPFALCILSFF